MRYLLTFFCAYPAILLSITVSVLTAHATLSLCFLTCVLCSSLFLASLSHFSNSSGLNCLPFPSIIALHCLNLSTLNVPSKGNFPCVHLFHLSKIRSSTHSAPYFLYISFRHPGLCIPLGSCTGLLLFDPMAN